MKKCLILLSLLICTIISKGQLSKDSKFNIRVHAGYSVYNKTYKGMFISFDHCLHIIQNLSLVNSIIMANGIEKAEIFRPNIHFAGWSIGPELNIKLFEITKFEIKPSFSYNWMMLSETLGQWYNDDKMAFPVVSDHSIYSTGFDLSASYRINVTELTSLGVISRITQIKKKKKNIKFIGISCQFNLR